MFFAAEKDATSASQSHLDRFRNKFSGDFYPERVYEAKCSEACVLLNRVRKKSTELARVDALTQVRHLWYKVECNGGQGDRVNNATSKCHTPLLQLVQVACSLF